MNGWIFFTTYRSLLVAVLLLSFASPAVLKLSIPLASSSFVYTPFVCNATEVSLSPDVCQGAWQMSEDSANNITEVSTTGSSRLILPQMFFRFRASSIYVTTSPDSNATVDLIVAWDSIMRRSTFDSSMGLLCILDLPDNTTFVLTLTIDPSTSPTLFGITSVEIATPPDAVLSSVLPPPITPSSVISPTSFTSQSANPNTSTTMTSNQRDQSPSRRTMIKLAVGLTIGLGLGLPFILIILYGLFRWRRRSQAKAGRWSNWSFVN